VRGTNDPMDSVVILAVVIVGIIVSIYGHFWARKRQRGMSGLARRLNLNFNPDQDFNLPGRFGFLEEFQRGQNRYATNVLSGKYEENDVLAFDYHYEDYPPGGNGRQTQHYWFSFLALMLPVRFPDLTIRREGFLIKVAEPFGYQDIKFESAEFSKNFCVRSPDKKFAYDVCNAKMIEYLLANKDLSVEIENQVIALAFNTWLSVERIENDLRRLVEVRTRLPEYLFTNA
jgi:hypothetical protein